MRGRRRNHLTSTPATSPQNAAPMPSALTPLAAINTGAVGHDDTPPQPNIVDRTVDA